MWGCTYKVYCPRVLTIERLWNRAFNWNTFRSVWIEFILLKLKTKNWKHCSKIIFKCVNSTVRPIFNEKVVEKWNLWVRKQCTDHCLDEKVNICRYCSMNSSRIPPKRVRTKKKELNADADAASVNPNRHLMLWNFFRLKCGFGSSS